MVRGAVKFPVPNLQRKFVSGPAAPSDELKVLTQGQGPWGVLSIVVLRGWVQGAGGGYFNSNTHSHRGGPWGARADLFTGGQLLE